MTFTFHTYFDGAEVYIDPPSRTELARYKKDSQHSLAEYAKRRRSTYFQAITQDLKAHAYDYIIGIIAISAVMLLLVYALPAMAQPMSCTLDYHTGLKICQ